MNGSDHLTPTDSGSARKPHTPHEHLGFIFVVCLFATAMPPSCKGASLVPFNDPTALMSDGGSGGNLPPTGRGEGGGASTGPPGGGVAGQPSRCGRAADGGAVASRGGAAVCYLIEDQFGTPGFSLVAVPLDGGAADRPWKWNIPDASSGEGFSRLVRSLTWTGDVFVSGGDGFVGPANLYVLDPRKGEAKLSCSAPSGLLTWTGSDWIAEYSMDLGGFGRFRSLEDICNGGPSQGILGDNHNAVAVADGRIFAEAEPSIVGVYDLCFGDQIGSIVLEGVQSFPSQISVVGDTLYALDTGGNGIQSILAFAIDGGARLGRVDFAERSRAVLSCTAETVQFGGARGLRSE